MAKQFYLSRRGQNFGPLAEQEVARLKSSGELLDYSWIWTSDSREWQPTYTPAPIAPEAPQPQVSTPAAPAQNEPVVDPRADALAKEVRERIHVIFHDYRTVINGKFALIKESEAVFLSLHPQHGLVPFPKGAQIWLNLLDEKTGKSENVAARLTGTGQDVHGRWKLHVKWNGIPESLKKILT